MDLVALLWWYFDDFGLITCVSTNSIWTHALIYEYWLWTQTYMKLWRIFNVQLYFNGIMHVFYESNVYESCKFINEGINIFYESKPHDINKI